MLTKFMSLAVPEIIIYNFGYNQRRKFPQYGDILSVQAL